MKILFSMLLIFSSTTPLIAEEVDNSFRQNSYSNTKICSRREYREEYIPGTPESPGYVKNWFEYVQIPCSTKENKNIDTNDCSEGSLIGGILGASIAASSSRGKGRFWAVPTGGVTGAIIGCQVDGG